MKMEEEILKEERVPHMLFRNELRKYFSYANYDNLSRIWATNNEVEVQADNGKWYRAEYSHDRSDNGVIKLKVINRK